MLDSGIVFGEGFAASVRASQPEHLDIISVKGAQVTAYVKAMLHSYVGNVAAIGRSVGGDDARFNTIYAAYSQPRFSILTQASRTAICSRAASSQWTSCRTRCAKSRTSCRSIGCWT
ncbi:hypothetical protein L5D93_07145 [Paenibacillus thiaminolyticus]|nr:hypothetical protein [Paenibacillus thiaminolyticus]